MKEKKICGLLNSHQTARKNAVKNAKTSAFTDASAYITNKPLYDAASSSGSDLAAAKKKLEDSIVTLNATAIADTASKDKLQKEYDDLVTQATAKENKANELTNTLTALATEYNEIEATLKTLGTDTKSNTGLVDTLTVKVNNALGTFNNEMAALKAEAPQRPTEIKGAEDSNTKLNNSGVTTNLNKILPN